MNQASSVDNNLEQDGDSYYSENVLTTAPSSDQSSNSLDIVSHGGMTTNTIYSVSQTAGLATGGTPGDVTVNIIPTNPSEVAGEPVTVQLSALFQVDALAEQDADAAVTYDVHYTYNGTTSDLLEASDEDLQEGASDPGSDTFQAKIGDSFTLGFTDVVSAESEAPYGFNNVGYKTDLSLNLSVAVQPSITMDDVAFNGSCSSIAYDYQTTGDTGPFTVGLYFSPTSTYDPATAVPVTDPSTGQPATQTVTPPSPNAPETQGVFDFTAPPEDSSGLPYVLAVADPTNLISPANPDKAASLTLPETAVTTFDWNPAGESTWSSNPTTAGGVSFTYTISGSDLPQATPIELYWASGTTLADELGVPITLNNNANPLETQSVPGTYQINISAARLGSPPAGSSDLLVVVDPPDGQDPYGLITEPTNENNVAALDASASSILYNSVHYTVSHSNQMTIDFMPAEGDDPPEPDEPGQGALTVDQAEALLGVASFNWIQTIALPQGWTADSISLNSGDYALQYDTVNKTSYAVPTDLTNQVSDPTKTFPSTPLDPGSILDPLLQPSGATENGPLNFLIAFNGTGQFSIASLPSTDPSRPTTFVPPDNLPFYYNLGADANAYTSGYDVQFYDAPTFAQKLLGSSGQVIQYTTELVGVLGDNTSASENWSGWGTNVTWDSNAESVSNVSYFRADDPSLEPPVVSGGITNVSTDLPPTLAPLTDQTINQGSNVTAVAFGTDPNQGQTLTYSLGPGAPAGAAINPTTGAFSWSVPSSQPPGSYPVTVSVTDNGTPPLSATQTFTIVVNAASTSSQPFLAATNVPVINPSVDGGNQELGDVVIGDFNGDGIPDMLVANAGGIYGLAFLPGLGGGAFGAPVYSAPGDFFSSLAIGDFSNSGDLDVAATSVYLNSVTVFLGNGNGTFHESRTYAVGQGADTVIAADLSGNGILDLATSNELSGTVSVLVGEGNGTFSPAVSYPVGSDPWSIVAADFDDDAEPDLAVIDSSSGAISVLPNKGNGTFGAAITTQTGISPPTTDMVTGDFEADGNTDLAVGGGLPLGGTGVFVLPGVGGGTFDAPNSATTFPSTNVNAIAAGDLTGDGEDDIVAVTPNSATVLINNGPGNPMTRTDYAVTAGSTQSSHQIAIANLTGDGEPDIAISAGDVGIVGILLNQGNGTFTAATQVADLGQSLGELDLTHAITGDFNGDGNADLAVTNSPGLLPTEVGVLLGNGDGKFSAPIITQVPTYSSTGSELVASGDFDDDGNLDLVLNDATVSESTLTILFGNGDGTFSSTYTLTNPMTVTSVVVGDFTGNGNLDIATADANLDAGGNALGYGNAISIYLNNGDGTFQAPISIPIDGTDPQGIAAADFNGDGKLDLVVTNLAGPTEVLMGNGDGTFQAPVDYPGGGTFVSVADFNGDGKPDFATVAANASDTVNVYLNKGDGTFEPAITTTVGPQAGDFVAGDFDGSGETDLVVPTLFGYAFLKGNGDGTFQPPVYFSAGSFDTPVVADINNDGHPDLVATASPFNIVAVLNSGVVSPPEASLVLTPIADQTVNEGSTLSLTAAATDSVSGRTVTYSLAPASPPGASINPGTGAFSWTPVAAPATVTITIFAEDSASPPLSTWESFQVNIADVPPQVVINPGSLSYQGKQFTGTGSFTDPGDESLTATVNYGDGSGVQPLALTPGKTFTLNHVYPGPGSYTAMVVVTDSGGQSGAVQIPVVVSASGGGGTGTGSGGGGTGTGSGGGGTGTGSGGGGTGTGSGGGSMGSGNAEPPIITSVQPIASGKTETLAITFSEAMDQQSVFDAKAYLLGIPKRGKQAKTKAIGFVISSYDAATDSVTLLIRGRVKPGQKLQATIFGSGPDELMNASGIALDGNKDGQPGGNDSFVVAFPRPKGRKK